MDDRLRSFLCPAHSCEKILASKILGLGEISRISASGFRLLSSRALGRALVRVKSLRLKGSGLSGFAAGSLSPEAVGSYKLNPKALNPNPYTLNRGL